VAGEVGVSAGEGARREGAVAERPPAPESASADPQFDPKESER